MATLTLYDFELDENCYRVRLALALIGLDHTTVAVNAFPLHEQTTTRYLALNPLGQLPILTDGDLVLHEAEAILCHLGRAHDPSGRWLPSGGDDFARVMLWLFFSARTLGATVAARLNAIFDAPGDPTALRQAAHRGLEIMNDHMAMQGARDVPWFAGADATIADIALFPAFALCRDYGIDHGEFPALRGWYLRFRALPRFRSIPGIPDYH